MRHVWLFRGLNLGARNRVDMTELRGFFEELGHRDVATYIQSGNVVSTPPGPADPQQLRELFRNRFGFDSAVVMRTGPELARLSRGNPFPEAASGRELHVGFMGEGVGRSVVKELELDQFLPERALVRGREFFLYLPSGIGRTRLPGYLSRRLGQEATVRNWNTVVALARLTSGG